MKKITEHSLDQFIRFPHELSLEEKMQIEKGLEESDDLKKIYNFLKEFYSEYDSVLPKSKNVIELKPYSHKSTRSGPVVLAAMSVQAQTTGLKTMTTLISKEENTVVRVLENQKDKSLDFHVLVNEFQKSERAILSLLNPELDLVTDVEGKLKGIKELSDVSWDEVHSLLRIPISKLELHPNLPDSIQIKNVADTDIQLKISESKITLSFELFPTTLTRVLWVHGNEAILKRIVDRTISFTTKEEATGILYFYE